MVLDCQIDAEIMTAEAYHVRFEERFRNFGLVGVIKLPQCSHQQSADGMEDSLDPNKQFYLVYLERHSFLAAMETSMDSGLYNVELLNFLGGDDETGPFLQSTRKINGLMDKLVLRAPDRALLFQNVEIEPDVKKVDVCIALDHMTRERQFPKKAKKRLASSSASGNKKPRKSVDSDSGGVNRLVKPKALCFDSD